MSDINSVIMSGRLTRDMEIRQTSGGTSVGGFSIAVNRWNGKEEEACFFDCRLWGKRAESLEPYLKKGTALTIAGSLVQERWEKDGDKRSKIIVNVDTVKLSGSKGGGDTKGKEEFSDDLPF